MSSLVRPQDRLLASTPPANFSQNETSYMQGKFGVFVRDLTQAVPRTLVVLSARMKKIDCFKGGTNKTLVFLAEMVPDCRLCDA
ncbi:MULTISPECIES: hypothetical protein [Burkholderia]|uniref:hypothetical protein n=1 Tax=Burkholderia TaxID=32008 RepID=UPI00097708D8|nr:MULTISPECIES: hypothetical protein [Burkholderia]OMR36599.1 hypothetical protein AQ723_17740 [Burkholderia pseudomallei]CAJ2786238.1 Uncharacterised protein [Burkholderia pseudomallei]CAJ2816763.1 Uncharacterised protein [Burkholderia pseudomallei]CAJ2906352.1 Uncharacterised protein [Burkholderia pseudomallei]CAJ6552521.1 Uncharacterised protein [Burkholderia pseudomallei]